MVCSESHFSVLFGTHPGGSPSPDAPCDLYYYDGLAAQEGIIKLSVTPLGGAQDPVPAGAIAHGGRPPLELVLGTRWGRCAVDWNGAEQIL